MGGEVGLVVNVDVGLVAEEVVEFGLVADLEFEDALGNAIVSERAIWSMKLEEGSTDI